MSPAGSGPLWFGIGILVVLVGLGVLLFYISTAPGRVQMDVSREGLSISGDIYRRRIPQSDMDLDSARIVDLSSERELQPVLRTNGSGLPGYASGWFRLRDGRKALLYLTNRNRALMVPVGDFVLLVSPDNPEGMLAALRRAAAP